MQNQPGQAPHDRFRPMDAVRALATTSIVALHAATPYLHAELRHLLWPVEEPGAASWPDWLFWTVRCFARGTLFLIAGFTSMAVLSKRGPREFLRRRAWRLAAPLTAGVFSVLPLMYLVWAWGFVRSGLAEPKNIIHVRFKHEIQAELYGFAHLWFLWYLLLVSAGFAAIALWLPRVRLPDGVCRAVASPPLRWLAIGVPVALVVTFFPDAIFDFRNGFIPRLDFLAYHLPFFVVGACMYRARERMAGAARFWWFELLCACAVVPVLHWLIARRDPDDPGSRAMVGAAVGAVGAFAASGLVAWSASARAPGGRAWRWLAERSFFLYYWHLPFVGIVQIVTYKLAIPVWVKIPLAFGAGVAGAALVYRLVKGTRFMKIFGEASAAVDDARPHG